MEQSKLNDIGKDYEIEIDVRQLLLVILDKMALIIVAGIILGAAAYLYSQYLQVPQYQSTARLYIINRQTQGIITSQDLSSSSDLTQDFKELVSSRLVIEQVISDLELSYTYEQFQSKLSVATPENTRILAITVTDSDPYVAKSIADQMAEVSVTTIGNVMESERANIIDNGNLPLRPVSPNIIKNTAFGAFVGMLIVIIGTVITYFTDDTIKCEEDLERYIGISTLGVIPIQEDEVALRRKKKHKNKEVKMKKNKSEAYAG